MWANGGACALDVETLQRNFDMTNGDTAKDWQRVLVLTQSIRHAIVRKDVDFLFDD